MIDARIASALSGEGRLLANDVVARLRRIGQACHGTLLIGSGDPLILRGDEAAPRVIVPLAWYQRPNPVGRDQINHADAVVLVHDDEIELVTGSITGNPQLIIAARGVSADRPFLRTTNPFEAFAATSTLAEHAVLNDALSSVPAPTVAWHALVTMATEAIVEAFIATGGTGPPPEPGDTGRR
jgi:hypothetical protein